MWFVIFINILSFGAAVTFASNFSAKPIFAAIIATSIPYLYQEFLEYIYLSVHHISLWYLFTFQTIVLLIVQFIAAFFTFYKMGQNEDTIGRWYGIAFFGALIIYIVMPAIIKTAVPG